MQKALQLQHELPGCTGVFLGRQPHLASGNRGKTLRRKYQAVNALGAQPTKICQVIVPSDDSSNGHKTIGAANYESPVYGEGIVLTDVSSGGFMQTRDCPTLFLSNEKTGRVLMSHAGKYAVRPPVDCSGCSGNIVSTAFKAVAPDYDGGLVHAWVVGGICPTCFKHDDERGQAFIKPFLDTFGTEVFTGDVNMGQLDLNTLIKLQLQGFGVAASNIRIDTTCPREHVGCASYRGITFDGDDDTLANDLYIVRH